MEETETSVEDCHKYPKNDIRSNPHILAAGNPFKGTGAEYQMQWLEDEGKKIYKEMVDNKSTLPHPSLESLLATYLE